MEASRLAGRQSDRAVERGIELLKAQRATTTPNQPWWQSLVGFAVRGVAVGDLAAFIADALSSGDVITPTKFENGWTTNWQLI